MIAVIIVYAGLIAVGVGLLCIIRPIRRLHINTRLGGLKLMIAGAIIAIVGTAFPAPMHSSPTSNTELDKIIPRYQFNEVHSIDVAAPPESVYAAMKKVTAREIRFFRILTWIRSPHFGRADESILNPSVNEPIIEVALRSGFSLLTEVPPREIVFGPGTRGRIAMNFLVTPESRGMTSIRTETRIYAPSADALRRFAPYWRIIYPGSSIIRAMWLRAIKTRAER